MPLPACTSTRPGGTGSVRDYRTLYVPSILVGAASPAHIEAYSARLCCVYTRISALTAGEASPYLTTYDDARQPVLADTFEQAAVAAFESVCQMGMGSQDCARRSQCAQEAMHGIPPTAPPSDSGAAGACSVGSVLLSAVLCTLASAVLARHRRTSVVRCIRMKASCPAPARP